MPNKWIFPTKIIVLLLALFLAFKSYSLAFVSPANSSYCDTVGVHGYTPNFSGNTSACGEVCKKESECGAWLLDGSQNCFRYTTQCRLQYVLKPPLTKYNCFEKSRITTFSPVNRIK